MRHYEKALALIDALPVAQRKQPELRYGEAYAAAQRGDFRRVLAATEGLEEQLPLLKAEILQLRAEAALEVEPTPASIAVIQKRGDAHSLLRAAQAEPDKKAALVLVTRGIAKASPSKEQDVLAELRRLRIQLSDPKASLALLRADLHWLATQTPTHVAAKGADQRLAELKSPLLKLQRYERAMEFARVGDSEAVDRELTALHEAPGPAPSKGDLLHAQAWAHYNQRAYLEAAKLFDQAIAAKTRFIAKDTFYAARALSRAHSDDEAIRRYRQVMARYPNSGYAEESRYLIGHVEFAAGKFKEAAESLNAYLSQHVSGRFVKAARRELAVSRLANKEYARAKVGFSNLLAQEKRAEYAARYRELFGVALLGAGEKAKAEHAFVEVIRERPLSLAAAFARARLIEAGLEPPAPWPQASQNEEGPVAELPTKAQLLHRIGLDNEAEAELSRHEEALRGKHHPNGYQALCAGYAQLAEAARRYRLARTAARSTFLTKPATSETRWLWDCLYPRPFGALVTAAQAAHGVGPSLLYSVMRQESAFRVGAESHAAARGLMQLIAPTARRAASALGETLDEARINSPPANIHLASYYLASLIKMFDGNLPLALASYNAGPHAVSRWLETGETLALDLFVARIPYAETRGYVHHVLTNLMRYQYLASEGTLALPLEIKKGMRAPDDAY